MKIKVEKNKNDHERGLHVVLINPTNGKVDFAKVFDTYEPSNDFVQWITANKEKKGSIVVAACQDDCSKSMPVFCKKWFEEMGSTEIMNLEYHQGYAFIGTIGGKECHEKRATKLTEEVSVTWILNTNKPVPFEVPTSLNTTTPDDKVIAHVDDEEGDEEDY